MSWSISTEPIKREEALDIINNLAPNDQMDGAARAQFEAAQEAAIEIVKVIPGPFVTVSLCGHANGVGWQEKPGYANDMITVSVYQTIPSEPKL